MLDGKPVFIPNVAAGARPPVVMRPEAEATYRHRQETKSKEMPSGRCLPHGLTKAASVPEPFKIVQTPTVTVMLHEEFNHHRQIFTDGRRRPPNVPLSWFGYSIGHWEDHDTFVVETTRFRDDSWLDVFGHPATDALRIVERYRRPSFGRLEVDYTIDDAKVYTQPWTFTMVFGLLPDTELIESICESERDAGHLVGD